MAISHKIDEVFTYEDYLKQMGMIQKMGSMKGLLKMIPGMSSLGDLNISDKQLKKMEAIILSMNLEERQEREELSHTRKKRIAKGSGVHLDDVNRLVKGFKRVKQIFKSMPKGGLKGMMPGMKNMKQMLMGG